MATFAHIILALTLLAGPVASAAVEKRAAGTAKLTNWGRDVGPSVQLAIGTPPQVFDFMFDTGSAEIWMYTSCGGQGADECHRARLFQPSQSTSLQQTNDRYYVEYVTGSVTGVYGTDTVTLAGSAVQSTTVAWLRSIPNSTNSTLISGLISSNTPLHRNSSETGFLGAGWVQDNGEPTALRVMSESWNDKQFGVQFGSRTNNEVTRDVGQLTLGGTDPSLYSGEILYAPRIVNNAWWMVALDGINVGGTAVNLQTADTTRFYQGGYSNGKPTVFVDSGNTFVHGPFDAVDNLYSKIPNAFKGVNENGEADWWFPCDGSQQIDIVFQIAGGQFRMNPYDLVWSWASPDYMKRKTNNRIPAGVQDVKMWCTGTIKGRSPHDLPAWTLGFKFLKNVYTAFRYDPPAVGFAPLAPGVYKPPPPPHQDIQFS